MGAIGGMKDEMLAAGWKKAENRGDFDAADEYEWEFFQRAMRRDGNDYDATVALMRWKTLVDEAPTDSTPPAR